ncbi:MAG: M13 family metallopeptidase N-terminal domain-containing protein, partial [Pseudomonadota bacterium]
MQKGFFASVAAAALLTGCSGERSTEPAGSHETETRTAESAAAMTAPELGAWGIELGDLEPSVLPGDDFYRYVNGKWLDTFEIPDEFSNYGSFTVLFERSEEQVREIIEQAADGSNAPGSVEQKIGDFFASFLDVDAINAAGLSPIEADLSAIDALQTHEDVARLMATPDLGLQSFIGAWVDIDSKNTDRYIAYVTQSGLGLPNRDYYLEEKFADKRTQYKDYIAEILTLAGDEGAAEKADTIFDLETAIAEIHWAPAKRRNRDLTYNLKNVADLESYAPGAPWSVILETAGLGGETEIIFREDDALQKLAALFAETPVATWKDYLRFHLISDNASILP